MQVEGPRLNFFAVRPGVVAFGKIQDDAVRLAAAESAVASRFLFAVVDLYVIAVCDGKFHAVNILAVDLAVDGLVSINTEPQAGGGRLNPGIDQQDVKSVVGSFSGTSDADGIVAPRLNARNWKLSYLLQANDDPSLLVPAGTVWPRRVLGP